MPVSVENYTSIIDELGGDKTLVAVSKVRTVAEIKVLYAHGQRDFAENYVQELLAKQLELPHDIRWHFIGHLQTNKVKYIIPFIHMIHGVDSFKLLEEIDRQAAKEQRVIHCLLQVHIAQEESKFGFNGQELNEVVDAIPKYKLQHKLSNVIISGLMGMASATENTALIQKEFRYLKVLFDDTKTALKQDSFKILSMGMSGDYKIALEEGSNMVRIGSLLFGNRVYDK